MLPLKIFCVYPPGVNHTEYEIIGHCGVAQPSLIQGSETYHIAFPRSNEGSILMISSTLVHRQCVIMTASVPSIGDAVHSEGQASMKQYVFSIVEAKVNKHDSGMGS